MNTFFYIKINMFKKVTKLEKKAKTGACKKTATKPIK